MKTLKDIFDEKQDYVFSLERNNYVIWCEALDRNNNSILENFAIGDYHSNLIKKVSLEFYTKEEYESIGDPLNWFVEAFKVDVEIPMEEFYKGVDFLIKSMEEYYKGSEK